MDGIQKKNFHCISLDVWESEVGDNLEVVTEVEVNIGFLDLFMEVINPTLILMNSHQK